MLHDDPAYDVIMRHLGLTEDEAYYWVDYIAKFTYGDDPHIFDLKRDVENLENLDRALTAILSALDWKAMTGAARNELSFRMIWGRFSDELREKSGQKIEDFGEDVLSYPETVGRKAAYALRDIEDNITPIRAAIQSTKRHIENSPHARKGTGRMNFKGIQLVNTARRVWVLSTGVEAPKTLNPATRFGRFVCDLFVAYEIDGDPKAAFRAWAAMQ